MIGWFEKLTTVDEKKELVYRALAYLGLRARYTESYMIIVYDTFTANRIWMYSGHFCGFVSSWYKIDDLLTDLTTALPSHVISHARRMDSNTNIFIYNNSRMKIIDTSPFADARSVEELKLALDMLGA